MDLELERIAVDRQDIAIPPRPSSFNADVDLVVARDPAAGDLRGHLHLWTFAEQALQLAVPIDVHQRQTVDYSPLGLRSLSDCVSAADGV